MICSGEGRIVFLMCLRDVLCTTIGNKQTFAADTNVKTNSKIQLFRLHKLIKFLFVKVSGKVFFRGICL